MLNAELSLVEILTISSLILRVKVTFKEQDASLLYPVGFTKS